MYQGAYSGEYICLPSFWRSSRALNNPAPRRAVGPGHTSPVSPAYGFKMVSLSPKTEVQHI
jgi:hypothetical protein